MPFAVLILAAGASTRMGTPKQLLPFGATTLLGHAVDAAQLADCGPVFVVLGANADEVAESLRGRMVTPVVNPNWSLGLGSSIAAGVSVIAAAAPGARGVLILLADQPRIDADVIGRFIQRATERPGHIVAAVYAGTIGVPAVFPERYYPELIQLDPSTGAKPLLERLRTMVEPLTVEANPDLDTIADYLQELGSRDK